MMSSKKPTTRRIKNSQHVIPANCAEISKVTVVAEIGFCGTWDLHRRKRSMGNTALVFVYEIRL